MESIFYVYEHLTANGEVFYVGKGSKDRAWNTDSRSKFWTRVYKKHGRTVRIVEDGMTEAAAFALEIELIAFYGRRDEGTGTLVNLTSGGEGSSGLIRENLKGEWNKRLKAEGLDVLYISVEQNGLESAAELHCGGTPAKTLESAYEDGLVGEDMWETLELAHRATETEVRIANRRRASILGLDDENRMRRLRPARKHREPGKEWRKRCLREIIAA